MPLMLSSSTQEKNNGKTSDENRILLPSPSSFSSDSTLTNENCTIRPQRKRKRRQCIATSTRATMSSTAVDEFSSKPQSSKKEKKVKEQHDQQQNQKEERLVNTLQLLDPLLQFLTKATGRTILPFSTLRSALPPQIACINHSRDEKKILWKDVVELQSRGVLHLEFIGADDGDANPSDTEECAMVGFPPPTNHFHCGGGDCNDEKDGGKKSKGKIKVEGLHGSSKLAAKRRLRALRLSFQQECKGSNDKKNDDTKNNCSDDAVSEDGNIPYQEKLQEEDNVHSKEDTKNSSSVCHHRRGIDPERRDKDSYRGFYDVKEQYGRTRVELGHKASASANDTATEEEKEEENLSEEGKIALEALRTMFSKKKKEEIHSNTATTAFITSPSNDCKNDNERSLVNNIDQSNNKQEEFILPKQAAYAGTCPPRNIRYGQLSDRTQGRIPIALRDSLGLILSEDGALEQRSLAFRRYDSHGNNSHGGSIESIKSCGGSGRRRRLYWHQAQAIESILNGIHTLVCTGTGSGKSLCFLIPVLAEVMNSDILADFEGDDNEDDSVIQSNLIEDNAESSNANNFKSQIDHSECTAIFIFPTKALAQDQLSKLIHLVQSHPQMKKYIRPGVIDGDTPHAERAAIAQNCNVVLTNPDTLHAAILPGWKAKHYRSLLSRVQYVVMDELHSYEGAFGAHVSLVLSRLSRICCAAAMTIRRHRRQSPWKAPVFVGCSATIGHPEDHFRLICPIPLEDSVRVLTAEDDGSPCAAKHFFVWNPTLLDISGNGTDCVVPLSFLTHHGRKKRDGRKVKEKIKRKFSPSFTSDYSSECGSIGDSMAYPEPGTDSNKFSPLIRRRHAADETARILAHAVKNNIRCIAFCKTRGLAEWVYERCISTFKTDSHTTSLTSRVEVYRGGYSADVRRSIEKRLFHNELFGVVGTSALELGIDIGGIDLTLHCGYPGSISSLMQQAGRAGRGGKSDAPSISIMIAFSSPCEQHLWRYPFGLLSRGLSAPPSVPLNSGIVQGHILCAGAEFPITGNHPITVLLEGNVNKSNVDKCDTKTLLSDSELFGSKIVYSECIETLLDKGLLKRENVGAVVRGINNDVSFKLNVFSTHPSVKKPWARVSMRSIEPINYSIVDMSHPLQGGRNDGIHDKAAIMDNIPYSRVFYHAHPGAIIIHRGRRYKIHSMSAPPPFVDCSVGYRYDSNNLGAFAKPTSARYSTRALSITLITVVKQFTRVEVSAGSSAAETFGKGCNSKSADNKLNTCSSIEEGIEDGQVQHQISRQLHFDPVLTFGSIAGTGVVTVKRTIHGYKKLSLVNRTELSRTELSMPPMEYDTNAMWIDAEASVLNEVMIDYDAGVHALSHAVVAVAPLFVPCTSSDLDCDHSHHGCTRILLFDVRAGGAGTTSQLWKHFFRPNGVLEAALDLLSDCPSCCETGSYKGGCPGCLQSVPCINFQQDLCRSAGLHIGRRMLARIQQSSLYKQNLDGPNFSSTQDVEGKESASSISKLNDNSSSDFSLKRKSREKALKDASDLIAARKRNIVVGRPTWPTDEAASAGGTEGPGYGNPVSWSSSAEVNGGGFITKQGAE